MRPFVVAALVTVALGLIAFFGFFYRPVVSITVEPATATISFAGKEAVGRLKTAVMPGEYEISIKEEGRVPYQKTERLKIAQRLTISLTLKIIPTPQQLTEESVLLVGIAPDKKSVRYIGNEGRTLLAREQQQETALSPNSFQNPANFQMSPEQDVAIVESPAGDHYLHDFKRYDLVAQEQFLFGRDIGAIDWIGPTGETLLYAYAPASGERSLIVADRTNKELERVLNLQEAQISDPTVAVAPDGKTAILTSRPGTEFGKHNLYLFDFFSKKARQLSTDGGKIDARFSPAGNLVIFTRFDADPDGINNQLLSVMDVDGRNRKDFDLRTTLRQIAFLTDTQLVVAVSSKNGSSLVRLDLTNGQVIPYQHKETTPLHINRLVLSGDQQSVFVTANPQPQNEYGMLYSIELANTIYE